MYRSFEELDVWKRSCQLAVMIYKSLRDSHEYGLRDQMQRAAVSIPSNIAEGYERTDKEFVRFLSISRGSSSELRTQCYIAAKIGALSPEEMNSFVNESKEISKMLTGLAHAVKSRKRRPDDPKS
ncbi:MAG: four helix bundle protein [Pirellulales bacterium]